MARLTGPTTAYAGNSAKRTTTAEHPLGTVAFGESGSQYTYVQANGAIIAGSAVKLALSGTAPYDVVYTTEVNDFVFGVAEEAFADNEYGLVCTRGVCTCRLVDATAAGSLLVSSTADGVLKLATEAESLAGARSIVSLTSDANSDTVPVYICIG